MSNEQTPALAEQPISATNSTRPQAFTFGEPEAVMDYYNAMLADRQNQEVKQLVREDGKVQTISGAGDATVTSITLMDESDLDEDEMARFLADEYRDCPYYVPGDEYLVVRKQM